MCGCSSVTAAIPRKQICRCGGNLPTNDDSTTSITTLSTPVETPRSPNKSTFRIEKNYQRPHINIKGPSIQNLERMDASQIYIHQLPSNMPVSIPNSVSTSNGYHSTVSSSDGYYIPQYSNTRDPFPPAYTNLSFLDDGPNYRGKTLCNGLNGNFNGTLLASSEYLTEVSPSFINETTFSDPLMPKLNGNAMSSQVQDDVCCVPRTMENGTNINLPNRRSFSIQSNNGIKASVEMQSSCCMPRNNDLRNGTKSSSSSETKDVDNDAYHPSSNPQQTHHFESVSTAESKSLAETGIILQPPLYSYAPQPTIFTNPASYGSFSNPVDASMWRMTQQSTSLQPQSQASGPPPLNPTPLPEIISAAHNCTCGATCQCIGCVAHPYNDATQDYVRSAWKNMSVEHPGANDHSLNHNGNVLRENGNVLKRQSNDPKSSPILPTPLSPSANEEEQSLSENDFFFINYSFPSENCEGGNCRPPCVKDCGCVGCEIHESNPG
ncbi:hypothetical protein K3495_g9789 [Podosphaera aphanis]|nr:hypothetical protein K3495_g9789 [Podosphaera aphanis]